MSTGLYGFGFQNNVPWKTKFKFTLNGVVVPLTGCRMHMQLRLTADSDDVAIDLSTDNGRIVILDGPAGIWEINVSAPEAEQVSAGSYLYDLTVYPPGDDKYSIVSGQFLVSPGITKDFLT